jgi:hypothetical protein
MTDPFRDEHVHDLGDDADALEANGGAPDGDVPDDDVADAYVADPEAEVVDGLPVLAEVRTIERAGPASLPAVQAAAAAATGFVAGAATLALLKRRSARKMARNRSGARRAADLLPIAASRSFLVDVHVIGKQGD